MTETPESAAQKLPQRTAPRVACFRNGTPTYFIFVEQKTLFSVSPFTKALMLWFATHYMFNLEYSKQAKELALFFQEFIFGLPDNSKKTSTYLTVSGDILQFTIN